MQIYCDYPLKHRRTVRPLELPFGLYDNINLLIFIHLAVFGLFVLFGGASFVGHHFADQAFHERLRDFLGLSSRLHDLEHHWLIGLFTYQFVHFHLGELLLSVSMLWLFGHILQRRIGQYRVILCYFALVLATALFFLIAHLVFPVFSQPGGVLDGAFAGVLGIMTTVVMLYPKLRLRFGKSAWVHLWQIYGAALLLSMVFAWKNNLAYIIIYVSGIYLGASYGRYLKGRPSPRNRTIS